jgi:two-component system cell cycle response regulator
MEGTRSTILVVDDSPTTSATLSAAFASEGYAVELAADGATALRLAASQPIDLVVLDVEMPGMDGLQVLRLVRAAQTRRYLPVLMLSGNSDKKARLTALKLGADDFLHKPWDAEELLARTAQCLAVRKRVDALISESAELHRLSVTDGLTQIANHRSFQEKLREEFRRSQRYDDPLSLILLDIDHFKSLNDRFGHQMGDQVLREVAASVKRSVRETDFVARYGGEEFGIILPKTPLAGSLTVAERVWQDLASLRISGGTVRVTASFGVATFPHRAIGAADQLLRIADEALYRSKREGRNKISLAEPPVQAPEPGSAL